MNNFFRKTGLTNIITSLVFAVIGILLINKAHIAMQIISYILGAIFILGGLQKIISYYIKKGKYNFDWNIDYTYGIIAIIIGIVTIFYSSELETVLRIIIDVWIIYSALLRLTLAQKLKNIDSRSWLISVIIALIMLVFGIYMLLTPNTIIITLGVIMLIYSIMDILESVIYIMKIKE